MLFLICFSDLFQKYITHLVKNLNWFMDFVFWKSGQTVNFQFEEKYSLKIDFNGTSIHLVLEYA